MTIRITIAAGLLLGIVHMTASAAEQNELVSAQAVLRQLITFGQNGQVEEARKLLVTPDTLLALGDDMADYGVQVQAGANAFLQSFAAWPNTFLIENIGTQPAPGNADAEMFMFWLTLRNADEEARFPISVIRIGERYLVAPAARRQAID